MYGLRLSESFVPAQKDVAVLETTVGGLLRQRAAERPAAHALIEIGFDGATGRQWTFGELLTDATRHRVLGRGRSRHSIPFFFEPCPSTRIGPLPIAGAAAFTPFLYGDHLWSLTTRLRKISVWAHYAHRMSRRPWPRSRA